MSVYIFKRIKALKKKKLDHLPVSYLFAFSYCSGVLTASILQWFAISSPSRSCFVRTLTVTHESWVALHGMAHSFTELHKPLHHDKAVIHEGVKDQYFKKKKKKEEHVINP